MGSLYGKLYPSPNWNKIINNGGIAPEFMGTTYLQGFKERCDQRIKILNIKVYFWLLASVPLGLTLSFVRSALRLCDPRNSDWIFRWSVDCASLWIIRFFGDGGRNSIFYELGSTCGTWCPQSKTDVNVKRESKHVGVSSNIWFRKSQENLSLSAFMLADNIGRKKIQLLDFKDIKRK